MGLVMWTTVPLATADETTIVDPAVNVVPLTVNGVHVPRPVKAQFA